MKCAHAGSDRIAYQKWAAQAVKDAQRAIRKSARTKRRVEAMLSKVKMQGDR